MRVWSEFLEEFGGLGEEDVRDGCAPRCYERPESDRAIVLVHGLTDSPWFMDALGRRFYDAGWSVYLPLLHMHGLRDPQDMEGVSADEWKRNVDFAIESAAKSGARISIGGLSTGGTLSLYEAMRPDSRIDGAVFLFAAAVRLAAQKPSGMARFARRLGLHALGRLFGRRSRFEGSLIGPNPYRYDRMDLGGVRQLISLIKEIEALASERGDPPLDQPVFAAHAENDHAADFPALRAFLERIPAERSELFAIPAERQVNHASLVLDEPICSADGDVLEARNPLFDEVAARALAFGERFGGGLRESA